MTDAVPSRAHQPIGSFALRERPIPTACGGTGQRSEECRQQAREGEVLVRSITACPGCQGRGEVIDEVCPVCSGSGAVEREDALTVNVPVGAEEGMVLRIPGHGEGRGFVERLVALSIAEIRKAHPGVVVHREARLVLEQIFENTRRMIAVLLGSCADERAIRRAVAAFRSYQVAGLAAFARGLAEE